MSKSNNSEYTTIQVSKKVQSELKDKKVIERDTYNNVIKRLIKNKPKGD